MIGRDHSRLSRSSLPPAWGGSGHFLDSVKEERGMVATTTDFTVCPSGSLHIALQFAHCPRHPDRGVNGGCSAPKLCTLGPAPRQGCFPSPPNATRVSLCSPSHMPTGLWTPRRSAFFFIFYTKVPVVVIRQERASCPGVRSTVSWLPPAVSSSRVCLSFLGEFMFLSTWPKANH